MIDVVRDIAGVVLIICEIVLVILAIGIAGGVDQNLLTIGEGLKWIAIVVGVIVAVGAAIGHIAKVE